MGISEEEIVARQAVPFPLPLPGVGAATGADAVTAKVVAVNTSTSIIGGFTQRRLDEALGYEQPVDNVTELKSIGGDAFTGGLLSLPGGKLVDKLVPIPNVQRGIALLRFAHRRSMRAARIQAAKIDAKLKAAGNSLVGGIAGGVPAEISKWIWEWWIDPQTEPEKKSMGKVCYEGGGCEILQ
ncbi:hypothetical protein [Bryobacter aggregatus]|uniref:hypothetical protein n=1 Tax=Bryobacter aggregatus TaxID=360054 RepID=UPI0004E1D77E|nr:hypothetical protein [Bryobacter aggregatus]